MAARPLRLRAPARVAVCCACHSMNEFGSMGEYTRDSFEDARRKCRNWGRWGEHDQLGTLNLITDAVRVAALHETKSGEVVSMARTLKPAPDVFARTTRNMVRLPSDPPFAAGAPEFVIDAWTHSHHGSEITHMDSYAHVSFEGVAYNGREAARDVTNIEGAVNGSVSAMHAGIITRGVLLDIPRGNDDVTLDFLPAGYAITADHLRAAMEREDVTIRPGDAVLVRTGLPAARAHKEREEMEAKTAAAEAGTTYCCCGGGNEGCAGLTPDAMVLLKQWDISFIGTDTHGEVTPPLMPDVACPMHVLSLVEMGLPILDNATFEQLSMVCAEKGRYTFLFSALPVLYDGGTGSPLNPIAIF